ncbi:hypothetical protein [Actinomadura keratinilytica]|uniref:MmpS family membrane protein n=1 Tax=Actinomadura keratinilytica TaxID=547461 RepID=A0ABP7YNG5_9ACTN
MITRGRWPLALAAVMLLSAACSSGDEPHTLTLDVTGEGKVSVTYEINGDSTTESEVTLPWRKEIKLTKHGTDTWKVAIQHKDDGQVNAVAYVDGRPITRAEGTGSGTSNLSGSVR